VEKVERAGSYTERKERKGPYRIEEKTKDSQEVKGNEVTIRRETDMEVEGGRGWQPSSRVVFGSSLPGDGLKGEG